MKIEGDVFQELKTGGYEKLKKVTYRSEEDLQLLIAKHPELIAGSHGEDLLLIAREQGVPGEEGGSNRWSLDHLFVTQESLPVLIEVKRASDSRIRREVVGQMMDYAANGSSYWNLDSLISSFEKTCSLEGKDPNRTLEEFLGPERKIENFWSQLSTNLEAGRMRLIFLADELPSELIRIIEFLSENMKQDVLGIEVQSLENKEGARIVVPRIVGVTERSRSANPRRNLPKLTVEEWLTEYIQSLGKDLFKAFREGIELMESIGCGVTVPDSHGSIVFFVRNEKGDFTYPLYIHRGSTPSMAIAFGYVFNKPGLKNEEVRKEFYNRFVEAVGPLTTDNLKGYPSFDVLRLLDPKIMEKFKAVAKDFVEASRE